MKGSALSCSSFQIGQVGSICTEQGVVLLESSRNPRNPETNHWRVLSLEVGGVRETVRVSVLIANQKLLLAKRNESWKWEYCSGFGWVFQFAAQHSCFPSMCLLYLFGHLLQVRNNPFPAADLGFYPLRVWSDRLVSGNWMGNLQFSGPTAWNPGRKQWRPGREIPLDVKELPELRWSGDLGKPWVGCLLW